MKTQFEALLAIVQICDNLNINYMLVGSFSSNFYSIPRATKDADIVIQVSHAQRSSLINNLPDGMCADPQMSFETATSTTRTIISIPSIAFEIELFDLSEDPFDQSRFSRRTQLDYGGYQIYLPTAEDVILQKLRWYKSAVREKDLTDAEDVYIVQKEYLDTDYLHNWATTHNTLELLSSF